MTRFVQIVEIKTSRVDEIRRLVEEMRASSDNGTAVRGTVTRDRDRPGHYLNIVEFDSYESAMENSARPAVSQFAARMATLCDEPPRYYNLDVEETWSSEGSTPRAKAVLAGAAAAAGGAAAAALSKTKEQVAQRRRRQQVARSTTGTTTTPVGMATETTRSQSVRSGSDGAENGPVDGFRNGPA